MSHHRAKTSPHQAVLPEKNRRLKSAVIILVMLALTTALTFVSTSTNPRAVTSDSSTRTTTPGALLSTRASASAEDERQTQETSMVQASMWMKGRVVSARTGQGVSAASIVILRQGRVESIQSNPDGDFEFEPPMPGDYVIAGASHPDFQPFAPTHGNDGIHLRFERGSTFSNITLVLTPLFFCEGIVTDEQKRPVPRAKVHFLSTGRWNPVSAPSQRTFETDGTGHFRIPLIPDAIIQAEAGGAHSQVECLCLSTECPLQLSLNAQIPAANLPYIEGTVLDTQGNPVSDVRVSATSATLRRAREDDQAPINDGGLDEELLAMILNTGTLDEAITDEDGHFAIGPLSYEAYDVFISTAPETAVMVLAGTRELRLTLTTTGQVRGHVFAADDDSPIVSYSLVFDKYRSNGELAGGRLSDSFRQNTGVHDASGAFELRQLVPGKYRAEVTALGFSSAIQTVTVGAGGTTQLAFPLMRASPLRGVVRDARTGRPLAGAVVMSWKAPLAGDWSDAVTMGAVSTHPFMTRTTSDGFFELAAGDKALWINHEGYNPWVLRERPPTGHTLQVLLSPLENGQAPVEEYGGVGLAYEEAPERDDLWQVWRVFEGSPAERSGIKAGDRLLAIDDGTAVGIELTQVLHRVRGEPGTQVRLRFSSGGTGREYEVVLTRVRLPEQR
ncbi:carboxypeptidase regulatory-like domain-containing protein [Myxococcus fulvus]|uniref:carboxypeptidase regulatory-like domain-containing protein n=1 Tax=Myxococcus fulvus TaxID=33 RepID=UPI003B9AB50B